ncbi:pentatricopeptide repeat-containing protein At5g56310 isoform X1 [Dendrobium catenatum]|uniref:Pentatricopeptide repeat-containing protein n=1 Tax=Dendrobium catenatum TaxID=906689 RepID=A0A2I0W373_9ASPA|nr:pentatricopeptide repeat-containing protein At5g56310 isoform X1 [Dendrobium catenatum]PKU70088.1 Pentatricopeptide repeat-containing protein [Dendrobium catenatum]
MELLKFPNAITTLSWTNSASAAAIRHASSPAVALTLFKSRLLRRRHPAAATDLHDSNAAVFTLKHCSSFPVSSTIRLIPSLHALLLKSNLLSSVHVSSTLLHTYSLLSLPDALQLFEEIPNRNAVTYNTMITCYARHSNIYAAREVFNEMPQRDIASWSAIICAYLHSGNPSHAFSLFREMNLGRKIKPDALILVAMLSGCADSGSLGFHGKSIHAYMERNHMDVSVQLGTSLIDMYAKSGCLKNAFFVFERMPERNVMHWTAMICGLASHGHCDEALAFFERMKATGVRPNEITFTGVLNAFRHAGLVEAGYSYFCNMMNEFGFEPGIHHYGCMVDLFANSGRIQDALSLIQSMKVEPNVVIWTSLLSACKRYRNFEMAEKVIAEVLLIAEPDDDGGVYALVSDLYALGGRWNDVQKVRGLMERLNVKKKRGSSFIEMENLEDNVASSNKG